MISGNRAGTHFGEITSAYLNRRRHRVLLLIVVLVVTTGMGAYAVAHGTFHISIKEMVLALFGNAEDNVQVVITRIRLPRVVAAVVSGWALSLAGLCIQSLLGNPLGSPDTLGISQGAAFGAGTSIVLFGAGFFSVTACAFGGAMGATVVILILSKLRRLSSEAVVLAGVALSSLFNSAWILTQYLATETELSVVVFWIFGDVARSSWHEIGLLSGVTLVVSFFLFYLRWDFNALASGEEVAKGLGVNVRRLRISGMLAVSLVAALVTAFHGVIAFFGLIAPHMARRLIGEDHCLLIPFSAVLGALLLLTADIIGRLLIGSGSLPVGVITSFLGAPIFLYLLVRGYR